ncbi:hypothetical protein LWI28_003495 [Acer negundo]|uniref:Uncharacterized protein n=1 Tax=Acer negundo TaxID=4023 RepID=A0AAD5NWX3_ACENE|nr:hypothetical protein LWI28_003495 [Acer negundo]
MALRVRKPSEEISLDDQEEDVSLLNIRQQRWRIACRAIYFTSVLSSLTRKVLDHSNRLLRHSLSHLVIDIGNENPGNDPLETQSFLEPPRSEAAIFSPFGSNFRGFRNCCS